VTAGPPISTAPAEGFDPDVAARLAEAEAIVGATHAPMPLLERALQRVLVLYESRDPFSRAQRERARPRSVAILGQIGTQARDAGDTVLAARALDARWTIAGGRDPQLADVLTTWAERDAANAPARALYLARRARQANPAHSDAARLDARLSSNRRIWPARLAIVAGVVAFGVGLYARSRVGAIEDDLAAHPRPGDEVDRLLTLRSRYDLIGTGLLIAVPVLSVSGMVLAFSGTPKYQPTSPAELPTLEEP